MSKRAPLKERLPESIRLACDWLSDIAQVKCEHAADDPYHPEVRHIHEYWRGAIKGEYTHGTGQWSFFCPVWHTGQAVKALVLAYRLSGEQKHLDAARLGAEFLTRNQVWDESRPDHGLILAYEDRDDLVNTSAILECLDGLIHLAQLDDSEDLWTRIVAAARWVLDKTYLVGEGLYSDIYDPAKQRLTGQGYVNTKDGVPGRPLADDAIFASVYEKTGDKAFLDAFVRTCERLIEDQSPPGNWIDYAPCVAKTGAFHPRHTYWWGKPLLQAYRLTKRPEFREAFITSGEFTLRGMRHDGGWIRGLYQLDKQGQNLTTDCFGHAASGSACAAIFFLELLGETGDAKWLTVAEKALEYCMSVQMVNPEYEGLKGVIIEKILPLDGTDRSPLHVRDLGTIFFITAAAKYMEAQS